MNKLKADAFFAGVGGIELGFTDDFYDDLKEFGLTGEELIKDVPKTDMKRLGEIIQKEIQEEERQLLRRREAARRNLER